MLGVGFFFFRQISIFELAIFDGIFERIKVFRLSLNKTFAQSYKDFFSKPVEKLLDNIFCDSG